MTSVAAPMALARQLLASAGAERREELREICGTRGVPDTVAPFRAWRGSRDLVAQSPKFHAPAVAQLLRDCSAQSSTQKLPQFQLRFAIAVRFRSQTDPEAALARTYQDYGFAAGSSGGLTRAGWTQFTCKGPTP
jgi:hypothetical protein